MERDQASKFVNDLLRLMVSRTGSDLFLTADFPPAIKVDGRITKVSPQPLNGQHTLQLARAVMNDKQAAEFEKTKECNFAISPQGVGRFRVNAFMQQGNVGLVMRTIPQTLPTIDTLNLPQVLKDVALHDARGLEDVRDYVEVNTVRQSDGRVTDSCGKPLRNYRRSNFFVDPDDGGLEDPGMRLELMLDLGRRDVLGADEQHVAGAGIDEEQVALETQVAVVRTVLEDGVYEILIPRLELQHRIARRARLFNHCDVIRLLQGPAPEAVVEAVAEPHLIVGGTDRDWRKQQPGAQPCQQAFCVHASIIWKRGSEWLTFIEKIRRFSLA